MADPFRPVQPGEDIAFSATAWNAMQDAGRAELARKHNRTGEPLEQSRQGDIVKVRNDTGAALARREVLGLDGPIFGPADSLDAFLREVTFRGVMPAAGHAGKFAVLLDPARAGGIARAFVAGVTQVRLDVADPAHTCADVKAGSTFELLTAAAGSAQILWADDGAYGAYGETWGIVRLGTACGAGADPYGDEPYGTAARCECRDEPYEITVSCGLCGEEYGADTQMPRIWWLRILDAGTETGYNDCNTISCGALEGIGTIKLFNDGQPGAWECTWSGNARYCVTAELKHEGTWKLTILDTNGCILVKAELDDQFFDCCGTNVGWIVDEQVSQCKPTLSLVPDHCTCCPPERTCPDTDTGLVCEDTPCCVGPLCSLSIQVVGLQNGPVPGQGQYPEPEHQCNCMNGVYQTFSRTGDCRWEFYGRPENGNSICEGLDPAIPLVTPVIVHGVLELHGRSWTLTLEGDSGQLAVFVLNNWDCIPSIRLTMVDTESYCVPPNPDDPPYAIATWNNEA